MLNLIVRPVFDGKYIKIRIKTFEDKIITKFTDNKIPKGSTHYWCIAVICVDSVRELEKENYPPDSLELCKFRLKKKKGIDLFDDQFEDKSVLEDNSSDESEIEAKWI